jgi:hypothetical protein
VQTPAQVLFRGPGDEWPGATGLGRTQFPKGYVRQLVHPFRRDPATTTVDEPSHR